MYGILPLANDARYEDTTAQNLNPLSSNECKGISRCDDWQELFAKVPSKLSVYAWPVVLVSASNYQMFSAETPLAVEDPLKRKLTHYSAFFTAPIRVLPSSWFFFRHDGFVFSFVSPTYPFLKRLDDERITPTKREQRIIRFKISKNYQLHTLRLLPRYNHLMLPCVHIEWLTLFYERYQRCSIRETEKVGYNYSSTISNGPLRTHCLL